MSLRSDLDRVAERISLRNRFPDYFNVWVFRGAIIFMVVLVGIVAYTDGLGTRPQIYMSCPQDAFMGVCANQFYGVTCLSSVPSEFADLCDKEFFFAGETYGVPPSWLFKNFYLIGFGVVAAAFLINHLLYWRRTGLWYYSR